jgi:outer membrane protein TolC
MLLGLLLASPLLAGAEEPEPRGLTLRECVQTAAARNLSLARVRLAREQAALDVARAKAGFYPVLTFEISYDDERAPGAGGGDLRYEAGVQVDTPLGTQLWAELSNRRVDSRRDSVALNPAQSAGLEVGLSQPLLRGLGLDANLARWNQARLGHRQAAAELRARLNGVALEAELAYWRLHLAQQEVAIAARSYERAHEQFETTRENVRRGLLPEHDLFVVEESLVSFEARQRQAEDDRRAARIRLGLAMQLSPAQADRLVAAETPVPEAVAVPGEFELLALGFQLDPVLEAARAQAEAAGVALVFARDQQLPRLDLEASFRLNGLAAELGQTWSELWGGRRTDAFVGLSLRLPVFELMDRSRVEQADLEVARQLLAMKAAEQRLRYAVNDLGRRIVHRREAHRLARRVSELARLKLEAQQEKYRAGAAALKDLVQFLRELDQAEQAEARALVVLVESAAELRASVGDLHQAHGLEVR